MRKFKKKTLFLVFAALAATACLAVGCDETHVHEYAEGWEHNVEAHWHPATCGHEPQKKAHDWQKSATEPVCDGSKYTFTENYVCKECGYTYTENREIDGHPFAAEWSSDDVYHWHAAACQHTSSSVYDKKEKHEIISSENPVCATCGKQIGALTYRLNADGNTYTVTGTAVDVQTVEVPAQWDGKDVTAIARGAFKNSGIVSLTLPSTVTEIPIDLCRDCTELESVTFGGAPVSIGDFAFKGCAKLDLTIPASVTTVGFSAFNGCAKLTSALPAALVSIDEYAFKDCTSLTTLTLPSTVTTMNGRAFKGCTQLTDVVLNGSFVGDYAFEGCVKLNSVSAPNVVSVGEGAFKGCSTLTSLTLTEALTHVGAEAFADSGLLTTQDGVVYAANVATGYTYTAGSLALKSGTAGIADEAFKDFTGLTDITLGDVRFIGVNAFRRCTSLDAVVFPASVKQIGANAFRQSGLVEVNVPATVKIVGDNAFYDCASLERAEIHAETVGKFAFSYTGTGRTLNSPVKERPDIAHLTNVTLGGEVKYIGSNAFQYCPIAEIAIPADTETIGAYAFAQTDLKSVSIPAGVTRIGEHAFYDCALDGVEFAEKSGWKAGDTPVDLSGTSADAATLLLTTHCYETWVRTEESAGV